MFTARASVMDAPSLLAGLNSHPVPPTPPKEFNNEQEICDSALAMLSTNLLLRPLNTPNESPESSNEYSARSPDKSRKRVQFNPTPSNIDDLENVGSTPASEKSFSSSRPVRSILKRHTSLLSSDPISSDPPDPLEEHDFPTMLEDLLRGLSSPNLSARFDAYLAMNGCLKTYKDLPSRQALVEKMPVLTDFIRRDLSEPHPPDNPRSSQTIAEAIRLITTLIWSNPTKNHIPHNFQTFILKHSIDAVDSAETSKSLLNQYLFLLATQDFGPKAMSHEKANRLLVALQEIEKRFKSKSITANKLAVHRRLLRQEQARPIVAARAHGWMGHLFGCLLSTVKEIRARAIEFGLAAGYELGTEHLVSKALRDLFNGPDASGNSEKTYGQSVIDRLTAWAETEEEGIHVPQIWSVAVLFCRNKERPFDMWKYTGPWLKVLQQSFNSNNFKIKMKANQAWTRLIYTIAPNADTSKRISSVLLTPLVSQMKRFRGSSDESKEIRRMAEAGYCTLLHYSLRPGTDFVTLDRYWEEYIDHVFGMTASKPLIGPEMASRILVPLFNRTSNQIWDANQVSKDAMLKPEELCNLDAKWIRSRASRVFKVINSLILDERWWDAENGSLFLDLWKSVTQAVGCAGAKEIKVANETMVALAEITTAIKRFLDRAYPTKSHTKVYERFYSLVQVTSENIGPMSLTEKRLARSTDGFEATETPSSRTTRAVSDQTSVLLHLLRMLVLDRADTASDSYKEALGLLLDIALSSATSSLSKIKQIREFAGCLRDASSDSKAVLWEVINESVMGIVADHETDPSSTNGQSPNYIIHETVKILQIGAEQIQFVNQETWHSMFDAISEAQKLAGALCPATFLIESLSKCFEEQLVALDYDSVIEPACTMISKVQWPSSQMEPDHVRRRRHGSLQAKQSASSQSLDNLYQLTSTLLSASQKSAMTAVELKIPALKAVKRLIEQCPRPYFHSLLKTLAPGLYSWVVDEKHSLQTDDRGSQQLFVAVVELWSAIVRNICTFEEVDRAFVPTLESLLIFGFTSRHRAIVNQTITAWNCAYSLADHWEGSENLRRVLLELSQIAELQLPAWCARETDSQQVSKSWDFADTPEDLDQLEIRQELKRENANLDVPPVGGSEIPDKASNIRAKTPEPSPQTKRAQQSERATPRLRHDNSQIEFAAIDSSPSILGAIDSQLLTDRQKEVMERQNQEAAAIFPDLRSSPKPVSSIRKESTPRLRLNERDIVEASGGHKEPISPTLPPTEKMTPFLASSPTPSQRSSSSRSSRSKPQAKTMPDSPQPSEVQIIHLTQESPSSPPSVAAERHVNSLPLMLEIPMEDGRMQGLEQTNVQAGPEPSTIPIGVCRREIGGGLTDNEVVLSVHNDKGNCQTLSEHLIDSEMEEDPGNAITEVLPTNSLVTPMEKTEGVHSALENQHMGNNSSTAKEAEDGKVGLEDVHSVSENKQLGSNTTATEEIESNDVDSEGAAGYSSDLNDLVQSQIERELESASQDTVVYHSPKAKGSMSSPASQKGQKKRGRPKRKREDGLTSFQTEEEMYDSITIAQPCDTPFETASQGNTATSRSPVRTEGKEQSETGQNTTSEGDVDKRPTKKSRQSSSREVVSEFQFAQETSSRRRRHSSRQPRPSQDVDSESSQQPGETAPRKFLAVKIDRQQRHNVIDAMAAAAEAQTVPATEKANDGDPSRRVVHAVSVPVTERLQNPQEPPSSGRLVGGLEGLLAEAQMGIPAEDRASFMRLSMQLMQTAMNAMEP